MAQTLSSTTIAKIEQALTEEREEGTLRTSVMTHLVWAPKAWLPAAERTLAALEERHPSRTVLLTPAPELKDGIDAFVDVRTFDVEDSSRMIGSEVVRVKLKGARAQAPASIVVPLLISDLPVFCRWRGEPPWGQPELEQIVEIVDRFVVDSGEWAGLPGSYDRLAGLFERAAVSDIAWTRTRAWRVCLAGLWPEIRLLGRLEVTGPEADALLLVGWLRSRLRKHVDLDLTPAKTMRRVAVDGVRVTLPVADDLTASDLLSEQLDVFGRDMIYEAAVIEAAIG